MDKIIKRIQVITVPSEIRVELVRKSLHMLIAIVPSLASVNLYFTFSLLACGTVFYAYAEMVRCSGGSVAIVSRLTEMAARSRDRGKFILGPVTLGIGAMLALLVYPSPAAAIAIYALAFGDSISSIVGKSVGKVVIPFTNGKTVEGSLACFLVVFLTSYAFCEDLHASIVIALGAAILEALPIRDLDNIVLPLGTGFIACQLLALW